MWICAIRERQSSGASLRSADAPGLLGPGAPLDCPRYAHSAVMILLGERESILMDGQTIRIDD